LNRWIWPRRERTSDRGSGGSLSVAPGNNPVASSRFVSNSQFGLAHLTCIRDTAATPFRARQSVVLRSQIGPILHSPLLAAPQPGQQDATATANYKARASPTGEAAHRATDVAPDKAVPVNSAAGIAAALPPVASASPTTGHPN